MVEQFDAWRGRIKEILETTLEQRELEYESIHALGVDVARRLRKFVVSGKMIRGGLVCLGCGLAKDTVPDSAYTVAAAVELFQSALLVHDDIMDRDTLRRGGDTIFHQYALLAHNRNLADADHLGESLGICAGDIAFFAAFELLSGIDGDEETKKRLVSMASHELELVGVAQMADVYRGSECSGADIETESTLNMYVYKTGRYTFSLPMSLGVVLSGGSEKLVTDVERIGEQMGVLFQIKDDEIGLFGETSDTGKPVGSDISEGKKTVYYTELYLRADTELRERLDAIFGNPEIGRNEIDLIRHRIESLGVRDRVEEIVSEYAQKASALIEKLETDSESYRGMLSDLLSYTMSRKK